MFNKDAITNIDAWLDDNVSLIYKEEPLAQDWARTAKVQEEAGEAVQALIGYTGQNPRKGYTHVKSEFLDELADVAITAIMAIQHFTKNADQTLYIVEFRLNEVHKRMNEKRHINSLDPAIELHSIPDSMSEQSS